MNKHYQTYEEIPFTIKSYLLTASGEKRIMDIPLEEINSFLDGLEKYYHQKVAEEYEDGWVL